jgi:two-component system catabolic regulation response regulator CreB
MHSRTILVVEDEPAIADNIAYALTTEGFVPLVCSTGKEALDAMAGESVGLVILDLGLPDVSGFDLLKDIRGQTRIPVIVVTARADEVDRVVGLEMGADDYVVKPFSPRELTARVRAVLRRTVAEKGEQPGSDLPGTFPFALDEERHRISYHTNVLELTRYEYRLLRVLVLSPGRVFSRRQLMEKAWEEPDMSLERTVDAHIRTVRQKLREVMPEVDPIETHRGVGYSLKETW